MAIARPLTEPYTYAVPAHMGPLVPGHVVLVPFGRRGSETGYVVGTTDSPDFDPAKIKSVSRLLDPIPAFDKKQLTFFQWISSYYLAPLGLVINTAIPSQMKAKVLSVLVPCEAGIEALTAKEPEGDHALVLREVVSRPGLTKRGLVRRLAQELDKKEVVRAIDGILRKSWVQWDDKEVGETKARIQTVTLACRPDEIQTKVPRPGSRMKAVLGTLQTHPGSMDVVDVVAQQGPTARDALKRLESRGVVTFSERERRDTLSDAPALGPTRALNLNDDQQTALTALIAPGAKGTFLLWGVTGSGKTEVFLGAAASALSQGKQVLVLVPEIGLTPQLVGRFRARFGDDVAVLHSGLTGGQRLAQWRRIRAGEANVAVGARSALFAPFRDLALIVVDEEHDDSYKQDEGVRYNARDCAVVLGHRFACPVVLASATPAIETWYNAKQGRYTLLRLPRRATPRPVPEVELVDLTQVDTPDGTPHPLLAPAVVTELQATFARGGQAIVLYNRRGFATMVECTSCGGTWECPNCGITMTLHRGRWQMVCHYCALKRPYSENCPVCMADTLEEMGKGTERIEQTLKELFPDVPIARMDADTTAARGAHARILDEFRANKTRLLVGTQIVAKGHDFPDVQCAVVVSADRGFRMPDFRAAERTWALLIQMAGRAGRGEHPGRVLVQTWNPDHYVLTHLDRPERFYEVELRARSTMRYPPRSRLSLIRIDGVNRQLVQDASEALGRELRSQCLNFPGVSILGPAPAALPKLVGRWRYQIVIRGVEIKAWRNFLHQSQRRVMATGKKGIRVSIDVDPRHLM
ncbi:MAG: primosomal protein N' [Rhodobacterales bacterium]|nr:primosomal protein N' [Rhodobacterales bacterium]